MDRLLLINKKVKIIYPLSSSVFSLIVCVRALPACMTYVSLCGNPVDLPENDFHDTANRCQRWLKMEAREPCGRVYAKLTGFLPKTAGRRTNKEERKRKKAHSDGGKSSLHSLSLQSQSSNTPLCQKAELKSVPICYVTCLQG